jgi:preprotein translocase subunit Sec61beta
MENNKFIDNIYVTMADKKDGFQSGAGLIRYFDEEEIEGPALDPKLVIYIGIAMGVVVWLAQYFWPV